MNLTSSSPDHLKAYGALLAVYLIWGTTFGAMYIGIQSMPWALLPLLRYALSGLLLLGFCLLRGEKWPDKEEIRINIIVGLLIFFGGNSIVCWAVKHMTTGFGSLMVATTPFWMLWLASVLPPKEKITPAALTGLMIGFLGMVILLWPNLTHLESTKPLFWISVLALLANTFSWSLGAIYARKHPMRQSSLLMSVSIQSLAAALCLVPVCLLTIPDWRAVHPTLQSLEALAYLVLFGSVIAIPCYLHVLKTLPVAVSSTFAYVTPVLTIFFGWLFLKEAVSPTVIAGSAVILSGVLVVQWTQWVGQRQIAATASRENLPALEGAS